VAEADGDLPEREPLLRVGVPAVAVAQVVEPGKVSLDRAPPLRGAEQAEEAGYSPERNPKATSWARMNLNASAAVGAVARNRWYSSPSR
jgi:hypothetical protein